MYPEVLVLSSLLTGRENLYTNMSILGLSKKEINSRFQDVVDFAEIGDAIDAPVQSYSSGMAARLGFASAIHTEPEILLIDEVLAVGDSRFKAKCYRQLHALRQKGTSFVLVNHNSQAILNVCESAIYLLKGKLITSGDAETVIEKYEEELFMDGTIKSSLVMFIAKKSSSESLGVDIVSLFFRDAQGNILESLVSGEPVDFCVGCLAHKRVDNVNLHLKITEVNGTGGQVLFLGVWNDKKFFDILPGAHEIQIQMPYLGLAHGTYTMSIKIKKELYNFDVVESFKFTVKANGKMTGCRFYQPRSWKLVSKEKA